MSQIIIQPTQERILFSIQQNPNSFTPEFPWPGIIQEKLINPLVEQFYKEMEAHQDAVAQRISVKDGKISIEWLDRKDVYLETKV